MLPLKPGQKLTGRAGLVPDSGADKLALALAVGDIVVSQGASFVNEKGEAGVVVEIDSELLGRPSYKILFEKGNYDGYSLRDLGLFGVEKIPLPAGYQFDYLFKNVARLTEDHKAGTFDYIWQIARQARAKEKRVPVLPTKYITFERAHDVTDNDVIDAVEARLRRIDPAVSVTVPEKSGVNELRVIIRVATSKIPLPELIDTISAMNAVSGVRELPVPPGLKGRHNFVRKPGLT